MYILHGWKRRQKHWTLTYAVGHGVFTKVIQDQHFHKTRWVAISMVPIFGQTMLYILQCTYTTVTPKAPFQDVHIKGQLILKGNFSVNSPKKQT